MLKYDKQIQRVKEMQKLTEQEKQTVISLIKELHELFLQGRFNVFPTYDSSTIILRWDKAHDFSNVQKFSEGINNYVEIIIDPFNQTIKDFRASLS